MKRTLTPAGEPLDDVSLTLTDQQVDALKALPRLHTEASMVRRAFLAGLALILPATTVLSATADAAIPTRSALKWRLRAAISAIDDEIGEVHDLIADRQDALRRWEKRHPFPVRAPGETTSALEARECAWATGPYSRAITQCRFGELHRRRDALFARRVEAVAAFKQAV